MSKYCCLISGPPSITLDDSKLAYSACEFRTEIEDMLFSKDKKLTDSFCLKYGGVNLLAYAERPDSDPDQRGKVTYDELNTLYKVLKDEERISKNDNLPSYFVQFFKLYLTEEAKDTRSKKEYISWESRLAAPYYKYAMKCRNKFVVDWSELNLNINNVPTTIICRKCELGKASCIMGHNEITENIRMLNARDFGLGDSMEYLPELQRIAGKADLIVREKKIGLLKWKWLDNNTFLKTFDVESVFAYLLKLEMIERWVTLDKMRGEKAFHELVGATKTGSENALEEFEKSNIK